MPYKRTYDKANNAVASYSWTDLTNGVGYKDFYPCISVVSGSSTFFLSNKKIDAPENLSKIVGNSNTTNDQDFDITYGIPAIIGGTCYINYTAETASTNSTLDITINVYHVTPTGTETLLGTVTAPVMVANSNRRRYCMELTLSRKGFAIGDKLRVNIISFHAGANSSAYYVDPNSRKTYTGDVTLATIGTDFLVAIPNKIDI